MLTPHDYTLAIRAAKIAIFVAQEEMEARGDRHMTDLRIEEYMLLIQKLELMQAHSLRLEPPLKRSLQSFTEEY